MNWKFDFSPETSAARMLVLLYYPRANAQDPG